MLEDIKNKINQNVKGISKEINNSASAASEMAKNKADSVVLGLATKIIISSMNGIAGKGLSYINNDKKYQSIIDKTWEILPLPMRLVGKDTLNYEDNMFFIRKSIFGKDKEKPEVDSNDKSIISRTIKKMFS
ncbi:MAG: hypothetical protein BEU01_01080 [Marine Group III euryarchaeote CG-Epi4]|uniref:Uncharacterized protein n=1 Tax=Marine Group III euryarchaeote CG-Epi4 TaxID=1888998 RepID=A0A1J5TI97_9ARCH|nr:MAG: hypothetical protein BEU01_01080 [Marine Group III euryarchaeote CG-Epi4]|tara:strand:+ start:1896 stop:2291 length:396 start_codon:yes stop_codon:yes gene_type:complete